MPPTKRPGVLAARTKTAVLGADPVGTRGDWHHPPPMTVIDTKAETSRPRRERCLELIHKYDMILATGHLGKAEIFALVKTAREMKLRESDRDTRRIPIAELYGGRAGRTGCYGRTHRALLHHHVHRQSVLGGRDRSHSPRRMGAVRAVDGPGPDHQSRRGGRVRDVCAKDVGCGIQRSARFAAWRR